MNENAKKIWITGASSGIGRALAVKFAKEGWQVAASARRENLLKDLSSKQKRNYTKQDKEASNKRSTYLSVNIILLTK